MPASEEDCVLVASFLHSIDPDDLKKGGKEEIKISDGRVASVKLVHGLRKAYIPTGETKMGSVIFCEQNKEKGSRWASIAKKGSKVTWILCKPKWGLIVDGMVRIPCKDMAKPVPLENDDGKEGKRKRARTQDGGGDKKKQKSVGDYFQKEGAPSSDTE